MNSLLEILKLQKNNSELWNDWNWQVKHGISSAKQLISIFGIEEQIVKNCEAVMERYPVRVTPYYLSLIGAEDKKDPIIKQFFPHIDEIKGSLGLEPDPFGEIEHMPVPGIIHRYKDRLVLLVSDVCAVNCRHCTRKNILGDNLALYRDGELQKAFDYIKETKGVREILVSGGDPFMLETERLDYILNGLFEIEHIEVVRIGTRVPVVLPMRIDDALCEMLARHRPLWINTQFNHPVELTEDAIQACDKMIKVGLPVSNQAVLLKGINDNFEVMRELCLKLQRNMMRPYYVFQCDPVAGSEHFRTELSVGIEMEERLRQSIGGLALPRFVADMSDTKGKTPLRYL